MSTDIWEQWENTDKMVRMVAPELYPPVTGVVSLNHCNEWIHEELNMGIDTGYLEHIRECPDYKKTGQCDCELNDFGSILFGDWKRTWIWEIRGRKVKPFTEGAKRRLIYVPDVNGPNGFAAEYLKSRYNICVEWSKWVFEDARWCFQWTYPNCANLDETGGAVKAYQLPPELCICQKCETYGKEVKHYPEFDGLMLCVDCEKEKRDEQLGLVSQTEA